MVPQQWLTQDLAKGGLQPGAGGYAHEKLLKSPQLGRGSQVANHWPKQSHCTGFRFNNNGVIGAWATYTVVCVLLGYTVQQNRTLCFFFLFIFTVSTQSKRRR